MATRNGGCRRSARRRRLHRAGEEHWHGATPDRFMAHVAIQEADAGGNVVTWLEHVTDEGVRGVTHGACGGESTDLAPVVRTGGSRTLAQRVPIVEVHGNIPLTRGNSVKEVSSVLRFDPFRDIDRLTEQLLGTQAGNSPRAALHADGSVPGR